MKQRRLNWNTGKVVIIHDDKTTVYKNLAAKKKADTEAKQSASVHNDYFPPMEFDDWVENPYDGNCFMYIIEV